MTTSANTVEIHKFRSSNKPYIEFHVHEKCHAKKKKPVLIRMNQRTLMVVNTPYIFLPATVRVFSILHYLKILLTINFHRYIKTNDTKKNFGSICKYYMSTFKENIT